MKWYYRRKHETICADSFGTAGEALSEIARQMMHPAIIGPAMLHYLKQGKPVERITVFFTHGQLHQLFSKEITDKFPLEITLSEGRDMEKKIDCRLFEVPWYIDIRTDEQKQAANRKKAEPAPAPTPQTEIEPKVLEVIGALFSPSLDQAIGEYQALEKELRRETIRQVIRQRTAQAQPGDTAHG